MRLEHLDHVAITVRDVRAAAAWYQEVLGLQRLYGDVWGDYPALVTAGTTGIALFPLEGTSAKPPPGRDVLAMRHLAFRVDLDERGQLRKRALSRPRQGIMATALNAFRRRSWPTYNRSRARVAQPGRAGDS